ncbi:MAG: two pore domain potassium channel family protein [Clostridia bacterium]|nr:two pore domain potassium channel family protein [Clostridia bacterium]
MREIVRKTYAVEIIAGLLVMMVAFSNVLTFTDDAFSSFWDALWYCFAIVTTIGFGDLTPATGTGRFLSVILGIYGIVVVALITSIIVNFYGEMKKKGSD